MIFRGWVGTVCMRVEMQGEGKFQGREEGRMGEGFSYSTMINGVYG